MVTFLNYCKYFSNKNKSNSMHNIVDKLNVKHYKKYLILIRTNQYINYSNLYDFPITDPLNYPNIDPM